MTICVPILVLYIRTFTYVHLRYRTLTLVLVLGLVGNSEIGLSKSGQVILFRVLKRATTSLTSETLQTQELDDATWHTLPLLPATSVKMLVLRNIATHPKHLPSSPWQRLRFGHPETQSLVAIKASMQLISSYATRWTHESSRGDARTTEQVLTMHRFAYFHQIQTAFSWTYDSI